MAIRTTEAVDEPRGVGMLSWSILGASIGGLMLAIAIAGVVAIVGNEQVKTVTERALHYDLEVEDEGDDLRVAVLDVRHYHRNIVFDGASSNAVEDFERAYSHMIEEIDELAKLEIADPSVPQPAYILDLAKRYHADFYPAIALRTDDPVAFRRASDLGLRRVQELDGAADRIDDLGEQLTEASLTRVDEVVTTGRFILFAVVAGVALIGVVLAFSAGRMIRRLHTSYAREQAAAGELGRALRTKNDFIGDASHELRTPLTVIRGNAEIGLSTREEHVQQESLAEILAEATRMSKLVDDLLFLARSDAGMPPLVKDLVPARWLVNRLAKPAEMLARQHQTSLAVHVRGDGFLEVDAARVEQAILILVDNAAKHAPPGTGVELTSSIVDGDLAIEVADQGLGIPPEELDLIFDRFYQVGHRRARKQDGSGLGLSIAKSIVEAHGGSIGVISHVGNGTRMTIRFPLCAPTAATVAPDRTPTPVRLLDHRPADAGSEIVPEGTRAAR